MMQRLWPLVLLSMLALNAGRAAAIPNELRGLVDATRPAGCGEVSFLFWDFYRAELWSDHKELPGDAFGLSLTYRSKFTQQELVDSSISEMARMSGRPEASFVVARAQLTSSFRDVGPGDRITAWRSGSGELRFFHNGVETGSLRQDVDLFVDIWLGEGARHEKSRQALLLGQCDG
jgi:hypothetical protein